jgi:hypothetical protein
MSYKASVLYDYPIAYWPLDDLTTVDLVGNYTAFLSQFSSYQDVLDNVSSYANIYGDVIYDHSGYENDGNYVGDPLPDILPIVSGNSRSTKITNSNSLILNIGNDYTATPTSSQFGTESSSDNDFTIEFWFYPSFVTSNETPIVADPNNDVGVFYEKGNITFKANQDYVTYTLPSVDKVFYVVCVYNQNYLYVYIDGQLVEYKQLTNFSFTNSSILLQSGPTADPGDYFLINSVAVYRYELQQTSMAYHMYEGKSLLPTQVAQSDNGQVFNIYDNALNQVFKYEYPANKSWIDIVEDGLYYIESGDYLEMIQTETSESSTVILNDFIPTNPSITADRSKIQWAGDNGISVSVSTDGVTYTQCINGGQIPGFTINSFGSMEGLYLRITITSTDTSKFIPRLYDLSVIFYNGQNFAAENGYAYITSLEEDNAVPDYRITFGSSRYDILSRQNLNGLKTVTDSGFNVVTADSIETVEFFYTPDSLTDSGLISTVAANGYSASTYKWSNSGTISKTNISAIYVNGVNKTSETNISNVFRVGQLHHVIVIFASAVSGEIRFNYSTNGSVPALYQYISIYPSQFNSTKATDHYDYYIRRDSISISDTSTLSMTEYGASAYDNDWVVIQSV